jgi:AcrR family transcriptional regulator
MKARKRRYTMTVRAEKANATRERIAAAALAIYRERQIEDFTLEDVARRAKTTVQTMLRIFGSKEELIMAALSAFVASGTPLKRTQPGDIPSAIDATFDIYENIGDIVIGRLADERRLPGLKPSLDQGRKKHREYVAQMFEPYLQNDGSLLEMLCVVTDVYVWKLLRRDRGLDRATAQSIMTAMAVSVIKECTHGENALAQLVGGRKSSAQSRHRTRTDGTRK